MEKKELCPGCMRAVTDIGKMSVCPYCGYDLRNTQLKPYQLKPYTMLGEQEKRYMVGRVVGEGAFGITYVAFDCKLEMKVAVKEFYPRRYAQRVGNMVELNPQQGFDIVAMREEMINEARNLAKLIQLEGVVEVKDYFRDNNTIYIVMEYIEGVNLKDYLVQNGGRLPVTKAKEMTRPVIESLLMVHGAGMIHRDISPDNIMVTPDGRMKLIDFGTAKESDDTDTLALGKKGYAPPEQFVKGGKQGTWTDVYALAATYYYCIVGKKPPVSTERLTNDTLVLPSQMGVFINPIEEEALIMALSPDVNTRFQDMKALYNAFYNQAPTPRIQPQPQPPTPVPQPPDPVPQPQPPSGIGQNRMMPVIAVAAVVVIIAVIGIWSLRKNNPNPGDNPPMFSTDVNPEPTSEPEPTLEPEPIESPNAKLLAEWQSEIDAGEYRDVIRDIIQKADRLEDDERDAAGKLLEKALDKEQKAAVMEANTYVGKEDYAKALDLLAEAIEYSKGLTDSEFSKRYTDASVLEDKYDSVHNSYVTYLRESGRAYAGNRDEGRIDAMFRIADDYFEGEAYEQLKVQTYTELVFANITELAANGTPEEAASYIRNHVEITDYNCLVIENLDFFRSQMNLPAISNSVSHVTGDGYILSYSSVMNLSGTDLTPLSQYELYLAYFEIYARHGRKFSDPAVNNYFSQYGWYTPSVEPNAFNENSLNEYEKANVKTIFEYQKNMGYR